VKKRRVSAFTDRFLPQKVVSLNDSKGACYTYYFVYDSVFVFAIQIQFEELCPWIKKISI
jgi:hypothetical protein